ncbi:uncharacterized protein RSE6_07296 [Rhynchosporium secalis]|uniref:Uncharacterized protein n=1 Tax=Rhynchosporium secalis TaxID=38038 RepID=A0A1E1MCJ3_RHYSE|nr:uncharacterized protein RSE6_07296 [Rhynchosporium secalis]
MVDNSRNAAPEPEHQSRLQTPHNHKLQQQGMTSRSSEKRKTSQDYDEDSIDDLKVEEPSLVTMANEDSVSDKSSTSFHIKEKSDNESEDGNAALKPLFAQQIKKETDPKTEFWVIISSCCSRFLICR